MASKDTVSAEYLNPASGFHLNADGEFNVSEEVKKKFDADGYIVIRGLLRADELGKLRDALESDEGILKFTYGRDDGEGRQSRTCLWNHPGDDVTGVIARSERLVNTCEELLGGEVYHYHSKVIQKAPFSGGAHTWHQDYGYWYENGCLSPDMCTVWIAVDRTDRNNGCVKVVPGSHRLGRVQHARVGDQLTADQQRVDWACRRLGLLHCELEPGDGLIFHSNVLHRSDRNNSANRRWGFLVAYNRASNDPFMKHHHPNYVRLEKVPSSDIMNCTAVTKLDGKDFFLGPRVDFALQQNAK